MNLINQNLLINNKMFLVQGIGQIKHLRVNTCDWEFKCKYKCRKIIRKGQRGYIREKPANFLCLLYAYYENSDSLEN